MLFIFLPYICSGVYDSSVAPCLSHTAIIKGRIGTCNNAVFTLIINEQRKLVFKHADYANSIFYLFHSSFNVMAVNSCDIDEGNLKLTGGHSTAGRLQMQ